MSIKRRDCWNKEAKFYFPIDLKLVKIVLQTFSNVLQFRDRLIFKYEYESYIFFFLSSII